MIHEFFKKQVVDDTVLFIKSFALDTDDFIEFAKQKEEDFSGLDIEEIRQLLLEPEKNLQISVDDTEDNNKSIIRGSLSVIQSEFLARRLFLYHWQLLLIESESFFITSDNPVVFLDPISPDAFLLKKCPVFLPISPKFAILIHPWQFASDKLFIEDDLVNFYVKKSLIFAKDFVFSHIKSREIQNLLDETKQNINELNYQYVFFSEQKLKFLLERKLLKI